MEEPALNSKKQELWDELQQRTGFSFGSWSDLVDIAATIIAYGIIRSMNPNGTENTEELADGVCRLLKKNGLYIATGIET